MTKTLTALVLYFSVQLGLAAERPNFLIIIGDDCTYNDLPLYGGENAKTPHIDVMASRGLTFNQACLAEAMCQPCRPETRSLPHYLRPLGYRVGLAGGKFM